MCLLERKTARRGRCASPRTFLRTRRCRRVLATGLVWLIVRSSSLRGLAGLAQDALVGIPDALALVRLGLADLADVGRDLADQLLVDAPHRHPVRSRDLERDAVRGLHRHRVRVADLQLDLVLALGEGAVAHADDLEVTAEAF